MATWTVGYYKHAFRGIFDSYDFDEVSTQHRLYYLDNTYVPDYENHYSYDLHILPYLADDSSNSNRAVLSTGLTVGDEDLSFSTFTFRHCLIVNTMTNVPITDPDGTITSSENVTFFACWTADQDVNVVNGVTTTIACPNGYLLFPV